MTEVVAGYKLLQSGVLSASGGQQKKLKAKQLDKSLAILSLYCLLIEKCPVGNEKTSTIE